MPLAPCSSCTAGDHAACDAANRPFCGCRQAGHVAAAPADPPPAPDEPTEVAMADVLDAATRAPKGEVATEQEAVAAEPGAVAPVVQDAPPVDPAAVLGIDPSAQAAAVLAASGLPDIGPSDEPDADESLDVTAPTGVVGLVDLPLTESAETTLDAAEAQMADAGAPADTPAAEAPGVIIMAEPRSPRLHVSLWDGGRATADPTEDLAAAYELSDGQPDRPDLINTDAEHAYAGTDEQPYRCKCGAEPGSLNKLGSHLGIQGDDQAMSELGKLTVPHKLASSQQLPPADDTVKESPGTGETMTAVSELTAPDGTPVPSPVDQAMTAMWGTEWDGTLPPHMRILIINGEVGTVTDFSGGEPMHPALADEVLEHFGFDPTPLPEGVQQTLVEATSAAMEAAGTATVPPLPAPAPAATAAPPALTVGAAMPARHVATPTQVQVARVTTNCAKGNDEIEPGQMIGHLDGYGWVHLSCATAG